MEIQELLKDERFRRDVQKKMGKIDNHRRKAKGKLKRNAVDHMKDQGLWNLDSVIDEFVLVLSKSSKKSSAIRKAVEVLCFDAALECEKRFPKTS